MSRSLLACALCMTTGCSLFFVHGPPERPPPAGQVVSCTTSSNAPAADRGLAVTVFALGLLTTGFYAQDSGFQPATTLGTLFFAAILPATIFGSSAYVGRKRIERCERYYETSGD